MKKLKANEKKYSIATKQHKPSFKTISVIALLHGAFEKKFLKSAIFSEKNLNFVNISQIFEKTRSKSKKVLHSNWAALTLLQNRISVIALLRGAFEKKLLKWPIFSEKNLNFVNISKKNEKTRGKSKKVRHSN